MRVKRILLALAVCVLSLQGQSWDSLSELKAGDRVRILDTSGREQRGAFSAVTNDSISLAGPNGAAAVERTRVRRVQVRSRARRIRNAVIGAAIGVAVGVAVDQTLGTYLRNEGAGSGRAVTYIAPIALFGGIAAAMPAYHTVYRAR